jgi:hypothetical protein
VSAALGKALGGALGAAVRDSLLHHPKFELGNHGLETRKAKMDNAKKSGKTAIATGMVRFMIKIQFFSFVETQHHGQSKWKFVHSCSV